MRNFGRIVRLTLLFVFLLPVAVKAILWSFAEPRQWQTARWSSAGILPDAASDKEARIVVFAGRTGGWRAIFAVHTWIVVKPARADAYIRYEVMGFGPPLRINGRPPDGYWLGDRPMIVADVRGPLAAAAIPKIEAAVRAYPYQDYGDYRIWPGPNSNTFVATVLRAAPELEIALPPEAIGKDYRIDGAVVGRTGSGTGVEASLYGLVGFKVGRVEGLELNLLSLVAGVDAQHPALKIPAFGRIGLDRMAPRADAAAGTVKYKGQQLQERLFLAEAVKDSLHLLLGSHLTTLYFRDPIANVLALFIVKLVNAGKERNAASTSWSFAMPLCSASSSARSSSGLAR
jgi:hypothetical protein